MSARDSFVDAASKAMNAVHRAVLKVSKGRVLQTTFGMPAVQLHVTGRTSGKRRTVMLTTPVHDETRVILVASKGGDDRHPEWYRNLVANPDVELTLDGATEPYVARTATDEEKAQLWPDIVTSYKGYGQYQERTTRDIPVVILTPAASSS